jgi:cytochrome b pre-mRNA-processing protein 3
MLAWLRTRRTRRQTARELYGSIVTQARRQDFYADWGVPDTTQGRFEMIVLHLALVLHRMRGERAEGSRLARSLTESFVVDMDDAMREMTFGDLAVPREIKNAIAALFDRYRAYLAGLASPAEDVLQASLEEQLAYLGHAGRLDARSLAHYMHRAAAALAGQGTLEIFAGRLAWPHAGSFTPAAG